MIFEEDIGIIVDNERPGCAAGRLVYEIRRNKNE
jgi:hypothetical protein